MIKIENNIMTHTATDYKNGGLRTVTRSLRKITLQAHFTAGDPSTPGHAQFKISFATQEEAQEWKSEQLKKFKWSGNGLGFYVEHEDGSDEYCTIGFLTSDINLMPTKGNDRNETGIKRINDMLSRYDVEFEKSGAQNSYESLEDLLAAIN